MNFIFLVFGIFFLVLTIREITYKFTSDENLRTKSNILRLIAIRKNINKEYKNGYLFSLSLITFALFATAFFGR